MRKERGEKKMGEGEKMRMKRTIWMMSSPTKSLLPLPLHRIQGRPQMTSMEKVALSVVLLLILPKSGDGKQEPEVSDTNGRRPDTLLVLLPVSEVSLLLFLSLSRSSLSFFSSLFLLFFFSFFSLSLSLFCLFSLPFSIVSLEEEFFFFPPFLSSFFSVPFPFPGNNFRNKKERKRHRKVILEGNIYTSREREESRVREKGRRRERKRKRRRMMKEMRK